ncbi:hypothetical protein O3M35_002720 [Rhynocoris fuscipes]|uniref:Uncharacterized protein n=1 Tax=Rhynocoris fuscipes TaxID=488301 RepID=A0AAW1CMJ0_9HEMI
MEHLREEARKQISIYTLTNRAPAKGRQVDMRMTMMHMEPGRTTPDLRLQVTHNNNLLLIPQYVVRLYETQRPRMRCI